MKLETSTDLLERVRAKHGASWYGLAKLFDAHLNTVYSWKGGHTVVDRKFAPRLAELLGESPEYVVACLEGEREQHADMLKVWQRIAAKFRSHAASILLGLLVLPALASPGIQGVWGALARAALRIDCILWQIAQGPRKWVDTVNRFLGCVIRAPA